MSIPFPSLSDTTLRGALVRRKVDSVKDLRVFEQIDSTNDEAKRLAAAGASEGVLVAADEQTAGRGRTNRSWLSPHGRGIYATVLLRPDVDAARVGEMSLLAGAAFAEALREETALAVHCKWPNDLVVGGKKLGGVLVEGAVKQGRMEYLAVGVGVNVAFEREELRGARQAATSLTLEKDAQALPPREEMIAAMVSRLAHHTAIYRRLGWEHVHALWRHVTIHHMGDTLTVKIENETLRGFYHGVAEGGLLRLQAADGVVKSITVGEVHMVRPDGT